MQFQTHQTKPHRLNIKLNERNIEEVDDTVFLGITVDKRCNWKAHVQHLCSK